MRHLAKVLYRILLLAAMPLILCSCATIPVSEIVPPPATSPVRLELSSEFTTSCRYSERPSPTLPLPVCLADADFDDLHAREERVIAQSRRALGDAESCIAPVAKEWVDLHDILGTDMDAAWARESDRAYRTLASNLLTYKQRARLEKYERGGMPRDMAWGKLVLTPEQRSRMLPMYLEALQRAHPAWSASRAVSEAAHERVDAALMGLPDLIREAEALMADLASVRAEVENMDKKYRDAERQVTWLEANLKVEKDAAEQIRLRKAIADQRADAEQFKIAANAQQRHMGGFVWRDQELARIRDASAAQQAFLRSLHDTHLRVLQSVSELRGKTVDGITGPYTACREVVSAAMRFVQEHKDDFPEEIKARAAK